MRRSTIFLTCMIVSITLSLQVLANTFVADGLVSYWPFDKKHIRSNKIKDVWGENDGTSGGNPKMVPGKVGEALEFDGLDDYVNLTNLGDFGSQLGSSTFEAWIKIYRKKNWKYLFNIHDDCMEWYLKIYSEQIRNEIHFGIRFKMKHFNNGCQGFHSGLIPPRISDGNWHHIVYTNKIVTVDIAAAKKQIQQRIYLDGKPISGSNLPVKRADNFIPFVKPLYLGSEGKHGNQTSFFKGTIDEVRIYNRALTEAEVIQNFASKIGYSVEPNNKLPITWATLKSDF